MNYADTIIEIASREFKVSEELIKQRPYTKGAKKSNVVIARQSAMCLIKKYSTMADEEITGMFFRDRTIIYDAMKSVSDLKYTDAKFKSFYQMLEEKIVSAIGCEVIKDKYVWEKIA